MKNKRQSRYIVAVTIVSILLCIRPSVGDEPPIPPPPPLFVAPNNFVISLNGSSTVAVGGIDPGVSAVLASNALNGFFRQNAAIGLGIVNGVTNTYYIPIKSYLDAVTSAEQISDEAAAAGAAAQALNKLNTYKRHPEMPRDYDSTLAFWWSQAGPIGAAYKPLYDSFVSYGHTMESAVANAQLVPSTIEAYVKGDSAGLNLLEQARQFQGKPYAPGMECSDLISQAASADGQTIVTAPLGPNMTVTGSWFQNGMGPNFRQIAGGSTGIALSDLAAQEGGNSISLPIGSVIVANGHAALFVGTVAVNGQTQLIVFDANNAPQGWTISVDGVPSKGIDTSVGGLTFPGKQVGEHVTRLQWGGPKEPPVLVKVFQPVGNHPH